MLQRQKLVQYRHAALTTDTIEALRRLEVATAKLENADLDFAGPPRDQMSWDGLAVEDGPTGMPPRDSMRIAGREVYLTFRFKTDPYADEETRRRREIAMLWALVVPLGFTPWDRHPVETPTAHVFHYLGPWQLVYDHLIGEGRGEAAWPSVCAAAQLDVGSWGGDMRTERFVQAQLHRIGLNPGPIDGQLRDRSESTIRAAGLTGLELRQVAKQLGERKTAKPPIEKRSVGHVILPNKKFVVASYGEVKHTRTPNGAALTVDGPGRVVIDIEAGAL